MKRPSVSALLAYACRTNRPENRHHLFSELMLLGQQARRKLAAVTALRSAWYVFLALRDQLLWRPVSQSKYAEIFTDRTDPWGYEIRPFEYEKFGAALELLDNARNEARFARAWEIGCAEGVLTVQLAKICERLLAVDFIPLALQRTRARSQEFSNISFSEWDLKADAPPGSFELIVIMDILGSLGGRREICRARDKVVSALVPGGYALYSDCLGDFIRRRIEDSWWGRLLVRGPRNVHRVVAGHPSLVEVARRETTMHLLTLFRKHE